jgi:hypothetical protein
MILPVPLLIVTPGFIVRGGCVYTGLLVPALNSAKALAHVDNKVRCVSITNHLTTRASCRCSWHTRY